MYYLQLLMLIAFILICCTLSWKHVENFWFIPQGMSMCDNVIGLNRHDCKRCANAGYCTLPNGESHCVNGDWLGSSNGQQCVQYEYGNDYANLSLIDPPQPYWSNSLYSSHNPWNWHSNKSHIVERNEKIPEPLAYDVGQTYGEQFFRHGTAPLEHHRKI